MHLLLELVIAFLDMEQNYASTQAEGVQSALATY